MNKFKFALLILFLFSNESNATIISTDWLSNNDNLITQDTVNELEWLDLTVTTNNSYNDINEKLKVGGELSGWRYATILEAEYFLNELGGYNTDRFGTYKTYYNGWSVINNGLFNNVGSIWGDTYCSLNNCQSGQGYSDVIMGDSHQGSTKQYQAVAKLYDLFSNSNTVSEDYIDLGYSRGYLYQLDQKSMTTGSALVREFTPVTVSEPVTIWLMLISILGLLISKKLICKLQS